MRKPSLSTKPFERVDFSRDVIVCESAKLADELRYAYKYHQATSGRSTWSSPQIMTYNAWLRSTYLELSDALWASAERTLISDSALTLIAQSCAPETDVETHARLIVDAWHQVWDWQLTNEWESIRETQNGRLLYSWFNRLQRRLKSDGLTTLAEIPMVLLVAIREEVWIGRNLHFFGFDTPNRAQQQIFNALTHTGQYFRMVDYEQSSPDHGVVLRFDTPQNELAGIATWAREKLADLGEDAYIGIVLQNLGEREARVRRQFESSFPEIDDISRLLYTSSQGSISRYGYWRDFTTFLSWLTNELRYTDIQRLGHSPHFAKLEIPPGVENWYRAKMQFSYFARRLKNPVVLQLAERITHLRRHRRRPIGAVIRDLGEVLQPLGWNSTHAHPAVIAERRNMIAVLNEVASMGGLLQTTTFRKVVELIRFTANNMSTEQGRTEAPIHVISRDQSRLLSFDALWVGNSSDADWPEEPSPNPFIPISVQREAQMPRVSHTDLLSIAKRQMSIWFGATEDLVFSYSNEDEETENQPSTLVEGIALSSIDALLPQPGHASYQHPWGASHQYHRMEEFLDDQGTEITGPTPVKHRTSMLKDHLECPFRSWGIHRMNLREEPTLTRFLDPAERGSVIHETVNRLAPAGVTRHHLNNVSTTDIENQIGRAVTRIHRGLPSFYVMYESQRLLDVIRDWIQFELDQEDFEVLAAEKKQQVVLGKSKFEVRIDRIDRTANLSYRVTDYKTGTVNIGAWSPDDLREPQMPLYSLSDPDCDGLRYVRILDRQKGGASGISSLYVQRGKGGELEIHGGSRTKINIESFDELKKQWNSKLNRLVEGFQKGDAHVRPIKPEVCDKCHLSGLCRIFQQDVLPKEPNYADQDV